MSYKDITETGPKGLKGLNQQNNNSTNNDLVELFKNYETAKQYRNSSSSSDLINQARYDVDNSPTLQERSTGRDYDDTLGSSKYDNTILSYEDLNNVEHMRAENQPTIAKFGAGLGKFATTAATTWLAGISNLSFGVMTGLYNAIDGDENTTFLQGIYDNGINNALSELNEMAEKAMPNYRTEEEQLNSANGQWYKNMDTMNFWSNTVLKNAGFAVGAFFSGGAITKLLKGAGVIKSALGARTVGSLIGGINEGAIEANQATKDFKKLETLKHDDNFKQLIPELQAQGYSQEEIDTLYQKGLSDIEERTNNMGATILLGNAVFSSLNEFATFGKLYGRGFKNAKTIGNQNLTSTFSTKRFKTASQEAAKDFVEESDDVAKRIAKSTDDVNPWTWNEISKKRSIWNGLQIGLLEGNEEMFQAFLSETSGLAQQYDSPDAYYNAITNPDSVDNTKGFMQGISEGFMKTYGTGAAWENFAVGAITGLIGMPTFGKVNNSDNNTWIGQNKFVGLSGGLFGEMKSSMATNKEGKDAVSFMNNYYNKLKEQQNHFIQSESFTNAMNGFAIENDAFEYKNAEDNDDFAAISRFAKVGKLNDLKDLVNVEFENLSDKEINDIALLTSETDGTVESPKLGGFKNPDGSIMSVPQIKNELVKKRDRILTEIDNYSNAVTTVRAISNNSLSEDETNELAWLYWKQGRFNERFEQLKTENKDIFSKLNNDLIKWEDSLVEERKQLTEDKNRDVLKENTQHLKSIRYFKEIFDRITGSNQDLLSLDKALSDKNLISYLTSPEFLEMYSDKSSVNHLDFTNAIQNTIDVLRLAKAANNFNTRLSEFSKDPTKISKNRAKIDNKRESETNIKVDLTKADEVRDSKVSDLVSKFDEIDVSEFDGIDLDVASMTKVREAKKISTSKKEVIKKIDRSDATTEAKSIAKSLVNEQAKLSETIDEFNAIDSAVYMSGKDSDEFNENDYNDAIKLLQESHKSTQEEIDAVEEFAANPETITSEVTSEDVADLPDSSLRQDTESFEPINKDDLEAVKDKSNSNPSNETQEIISKLNPELIDQLQSVIRTYIKHRPDISSQELFNEIINSKSFTLLVNDGIANNVNGIKMFSVLKELINNELNSDNSTSSQVTQESQEIEVDEFVTTIPVGQSYESTVEDTDKITFGSSGAVNYSYWKPKSTLYPIGKKPGDDTFFHNTNLSSREPNVQQRIKVVGEYLVKTGAFDRIKNDELKPGDTVKFGIDSELSEKAGETVILMLDSNGNPIGDMMPVTADVASKQKHLIQFTELLLKEYEDAGKPAKFVSKYTSQIAENLIGKVNFTSGDTYYLKQIFEGKENELMLGVAIANGSMSPILVEPGRRASQGLSQREKGVLSPLNAIAGMPYVLIKTSNTKGKKYVPVAINTHPFNVEMANNTVLGTIINDLLEQLGNSTTNPSLKKSLLSKLHEFIQFDGSTFGVTSDINRMKQQLYNRPINISRRYINGQYTTSDGTVYNYNSIIGEIAYAPIKIGETHTVNDWFTINPIDGNGNQVKAGRVKNVILASNPVPKAKRKDTTSQNTTNVEQTTSDKSQPIVKLGNELLDNSEKQNVEDYIKKPTVKKLVGNRNSVKYKMFETLTQDQQKFIYELSTKPGPNATRIIEKLSRGFDVTSKSFNFDITELFNSPKYSVVKNEKQGNLKQISKEVKWLGRMLPQLLDSNKLQIVEGLIRISNSTNSDFAWGMFKDGLIKISNVATIGTVYHEAFHSVVNTMLSNNEKSELFNHAKNKYGDKSELELEELLADDFKKYMILEQTPVIGGVVKIYRKLKNAINNLVGNPNVVDTLFYRINNGSFAKKSDNTLTVKSISDIRQYQSNKFRYSNLNNTDKQFLNDKGISQKEYNSMSLLEKNILFKCK